MYCKISKIIPALASTINNLAVPAPPISSGSSFAAVVLAAAAAAKENQSAAPAEAAKPVLRRPLPNARSRWKKLTGTAMFINRLGKKSSWPPEAFDFWMVLWISKPTDC